MVRRTRRELLQIYLGWGRLVEMRVWIFNPFDDVPGEGKPQRYWTLAEELAAAGNQVVWWSSDWSHRRKAWRRLAREAEGKWNPASRISPFRFQVSALSPPTPRIPRPASRISPLRFQVSALIPQPPPHPETRIPNPEFRIMHPAPTILYCGNFGNLHDSATLFAYWQRATSEERRADGGSDAAKSGNPRGRDGQSTSVFRPAQWRFHCSGPKRAEIESMLRSLRQALSESVHLGGGLSRAEWIAAMEAVEVALVTMTRGAEQVVMPSKTYSAMMSGQAILAISPEDSDLVDLIKEADYGWWVEPGDVDGLMEAIAVISTEPEQLLEKRECAFRYAHQNFGQDILAKQWIEVIWERKWNEPKMTDGHRSEKK